SSVMKLWPLERPHLRSHAGAWERAEEDLSGELVPGLGVSNTMINRRLLIVLLFAPFAFMLTGCPRLAYIEAHNNTPTALTIEEPTLEREIYLKSGQTARFRFGGQYFNVKSGHGTLNYPRNIPFSGEYGPYYDGTLRIQINPDGVIYALKTSEAPPLSDFSEQPNGYPLAGFEEGNTLFASCLDEIQKKWEELIGIQERSGPIKSSDIKLISCLDRLQTKKAAESRR
ncbi:hypothetical protein, partial [Candidatus Thiosymbion oneisti]|uniref:hypothetical protein n=1 Tax=Candidatus Thiosymbion oneisti TaxID=589554 RepID=UPI001C403202